MSQPRPAFKIWLETEDGYVFGPGVYDLLKAIEEKETLKEASQSLGMSYRYAWGLIKKAEDKLGAPLIDASKGGKHGGGSSHITELGKHYILDFERIQKMWLDFREKYSNSLKVSATVLNLDGDLAIRIDEPIYLTKSMFLSEGDRVELRIMFT